MVLPYSPLQTLSKQPRLEKKAGRFATRFLKSSLHADRLPARLFASLDSERHTNVRSNTHCAALHG